MIKEYADYDGIGLAQLIKSKQISATELAETAIYYIEKLNPQLNAVIYPIYDEALKTTRSPLPKGMFEGVPFLIKDWLTTYAAPPYSKGYHTLKGNISRNDSALMAKYKAAGVVTLGKTNASEFGLYTHTEPKAFGATLNPWDLKRISGGSSGGSAAAVAAGMVPIASGDDGGGSIRIPASCCGLFGFKPSQGLVNTGHILTRSVRDSAAMLDIISHKPGFIKELTTPSAKLRIAYTTESPLSTSVDPVCIKAVEKTVKILKELGHQVEETKPNYDGVTLAKAFMIMCFEEAANEIEELKKILGRDINKSDIEPITQTMGLLRKAYTAAELLKYKAEWNKTAKVMGHFHQTFDVYVTPTLAVVPPKAGELKATFFQQVLINIVNQFNLGDLLKASGLVDNLIMESFAKMPFTHMPNLTGQPAMSVPLYWTNKKLPIGVQFIAAAGNDALLFKLAAQLEKQQPWFNKHPPVFAH
jgi:amidase